MRESVNTLWKWKSTFTILEYKVTNTEMKKGRVDNEVQDWSYRDMSVNSWVCIDGKNFREVCMCVHVCEHAHADIYCLSLPSEKQCTPVVISTANTQILVSKCLSPLKRTRAPWTWMIQELEQERTGESGIPVAPKRTCPKNNGDISNGHLS